MPDFFDAFAGYTPHPLNFVATPLLHLLLHTHSGKLQSQFSACFKYHGHKITTITVLLNFNLLEAGEFLNHNFVIFSRTCYT